MFPPPLSDQDIKRMLNDNVNVMKYSALTDYDNILDALSPSGNLVILYETAKNFGHWVCLTLVKDTIYFFDSYGLKIDDEFLNIDDSFKLKNKQDFRYLSFLLAMTPDNIYIDYNDYCFQGLEPDNANCGYWCVLRLLNRHLNAEQFIDLFKSDKRVKADEILGGLFHC